MHVRSGTLLIVFVALSALSCDPRAFAQKTSGALLPDAPAAQIEAAQALAKQSPQNPQVPAGQQGSPQTAPAAGASQAGPAKDSNSSLAGSSSAQQPQTGAPQTEHQQAQQQLKKEEHQRILGVVPNFNTSYQWNAASLTAGEKVQLAFRSAIDPFTFAAAGMVAGLHEAFDEDTGFGWGIEGYGKRTGAAYLDAFDGDMIGNGILPAVFHQDPRFFRLGHGAFRHRLFYAIATSYICRGDNGHWQPNYSNVGGNIIAGAISNLYYPSQNSGWGQTISNGFIVTTEGTFGGVFQEFWPDISRKVLHRNPARGAGPPAQAEYKAGQAAR